MQRDIGTEGARRSGVRTSLDDVVARVTRRAFVYDHPASFRAGVEELKAAIREAELDVALDRPAFETAVDRSRRYSVTEDGTALRYIESF